jgi:glycine dehydrogenase subunit 1
LVASVVALEGVAMNYIPNLHLKEEMLKEMGLKSIDQLFEDIPENIRLKDVDLPEGLSEMDAAREVSTILGKNLTCSEAASFLGGGIYRHYIPSAVNAIGGRSEFYTAYTPYQPEVSQGMLQSLWEYQSFIAELTGLPIVNTSMYDWATALGEAARMALRITRKKKVIISRAIHWDRKSVLINYLKGTGASLVEIPFDMNTGMLDMEALKGEVDNETAAVYLENPNFFGVWEENALEIKEIAEKAQVIVGTNPISLGVAKPPAEYGADMVIGEAQHLGSPMAFGGPSLGILAARKEHLRQMPGRIIGMTKDLDGKRAFAMTLQTREQHIRRAKATSNICSNEALLAVRSAAYLALVGNDLKNIAEICAVKARWLAAEISQLHEYRAPIFDSCHFNEFVYVGPSAKLAYRNLLNENIFAGIKLKAQFPELGDAMLVTTTELTTQEDMVRYVEALKTVEVSSDV